MTDYNKTDYIKLCNELFNEYLALCESNRIKGHQVLISAIYIVDRLAEQATSFVSLKDDNKKAITFAKEIEEVLMQNMKKIIKNLEENNDLKEYN
jgi:hypothetical protein